MYSKKNVKCNNLCIELQHIYIKSIFSFIFNKINAKLRNNIIIKITLLNVGYIIQLILNNTREHKCIRVIVSTMDFYRINGLNIDILVNS
jgi:hypothetical protein